MSKRARIFSATGVLAVMLLGGMVAVIARDLGDGSSLLADVERRTELHYATIVNLPALRSPAEDCDGLQRQLDLFKKIAPPDLLHEIEFRPGAPLSPTLYAFLMDHENGFDSVLDATRCTSTKLTRIENGREIRPPFAIVKVMLWRAEIQSTPRLEPAACVTWCNEVLRATLDDRPGSASISQWQMRLVPAVESRMSECALAVDKPSATVAAQNLQRMLDAWTPLSEQIEGEILETAATLSFYYEAGEEKKWPFHGPRAHLQFRRVLQNDHALLDRPEKWKVVDSGSFAARLAALRTELAARDIRPVPFGESVVVSPGWDISVGTSNSSAESLEEDLSAYVKVQTVVRMAYASLIAPDGDLSTHAGDALVIDPFSEKNIFHWDAAKKSYYSVGPNGVDDGGTGDDIASRSS